MSPPFFGVPGEPDEAAEGEPVPALTCTVGIAVCGVGEALVAPELELELDDEEALVAADVPLLLPPQAVSRAPTAGMERKIDERLINSRRVLD